MISRKQLMKGEVQERDANEQKRSGGLQKKKKEREEDDLPAEERPRIECAGSIPFDSSSGSFQLVISQ